MSTHWSAFLDLICKSHILYLFAQACSLSFIMLDFMSYCNSNLFSLMTGFSLVFLALEQSGKNLYQSVSKAAVETVNHK